MLNKLFKQEKLFFGLSITDWLVMKLGIIVYAVLSLWNITKSSIWFDEAFGAYLIRFDFFEIAKYTAADVHPPMYYWLLKLWSMVFGDSEVALRSLSVLFGAIAIVFGYLLINKLFNKNAARLSLIFMVLSPMLIRYGQEARMYTLATVIALAATYALIHAIKTKKRLPWIIYGILVSIGMWVHYFVAIIWISHWIWRADVVRRSAPKAKFFKAFFSKEWLLAHFVAVGLFLPWAPFFVSQLFTVQAFGFWIPPVTPGTLINFMTNVFYYQDVGQVTGWLALIFWAVILVITMLAFRIYKYQKHNIRQNYRLIITLAFVPMITLFLLSMPPLRSSFIDRYLIASTLGIALFIGVTVSLSSKFIKKNCQKSIIFIVIIMMMFGISNVWYLGNYNKNSKAANATRQIIQAVKSRADINQPIIADTPWFFYEVVYYESDNHKVYFIDQSEYKFGSLVMLRDNDQFKIKDFDKFATDNPVFWYVGYSIEGKLEAAYENWDPIQEITIEDEISGGPAYRAIQYKISK